MLNVTDVLHFLKKTSFDFSPLFTQAWLSQRKLKQKVFRFLDNERIFMQGWCLLCGFKFNHIQVSHQVPCTLHSSCFFPLSHVRTHMSLTHSHGSHVSKSIEYLVALSTVYWYCLKFKQRLTTRVCLCKRKGV